VQVVAELIELGDYQGVVAETVAACLSTMTSGCWLDMLTNPRSMSRQQAVQICMSYLVTTFPQHFSERSIAA